MPIACSTCDAPDLARRTGRAGRHGTPARSKAISAVSAVRPGSGEERGVGQALLPAPKITTSGAISRSPASSRRAERAMRDASSRPRGSAARAAAPKPAMPGDVLGPGPRAPLLPAAAQHALGDVQRRGATQRARRRPADRRSCGPRRRRGRRRCRRCRSRPCRRPARRRNAAARHAACSEVGGRPHGLDDAGLVVGRLQADEGALARFAPCRPAGCRASRGRRRRSGATGIRSIRSLGEPRAVQHARVLDGAGQQPVQRALVARRASMPGVSARTFASVPPLVNTTLRAPAPDQRGDRRPARARPGRARRGPRRERKTDCRQPPAPQRPRRCLGPHGRGRVVVEIGAGCARMDPGSAWLQRNGLLRHRQRRKRSKCLHSTPALVLKARSQPIGRPATSGNGATGC